jgi:hypothetical protein
VLLTRSRVRMAKLEAQSLFLGVALIQRRCPVA